MSDSTPPIRHVIGCMTGTSLDGLDAALVRIEGRGLDMRASFVEMASVSLGELREELRHFASGGAAEPLRYLRAARQLGELHASAIAELCVKSKIENPKSQIAFVVAHGQTIWHAPDDPVTRGNPPPLPLGEGRGEGSASPAMSPGAGVSWQLFDPWPIVRRLGVPVCYDLRQADLIAGGQGAPITPLSDWVMYCKPGVTRVIANLGGICNVTVIPRDKPPDAITGGDIGPCNLLIDGVVRTFFPDLAYDKDGAIAGKCGGGLGPSMYREIFGHDAWGDEGSKPRSLGREQYTDEWVRAIAHKTREVIAGTPGADEVIVSAAVETVAARIAVYLRDVSRPYELVLAGGGAKNKTLVRRIIKDVVADVSLSEQLGIPGDAREAMGFAVLGALSQDGVPITLPRVTGAANPGRAGAWVYP